MAAAAAAAAAAASAGRLLKNAAIREAIAAAEDQILTTAITESGITLERTLWCVSTRSAKSTRP